MHAWIKCTYYQLDIDISLYLGAGWLLDIIFCYRNYVHCAKALQNEDNRLFLEPNQQITSHGVVYGSTTKVRFTISFV